MERISMRKVNHRTPEQISHASLVTVRELAESTGYSVAFLYQKASEGCFRIINGKCSKTEALAAWSNGWAVKKTKAA